jgi:hypothetical protein
MRLCSIPGCGLPHMARGWCNSHHKRWKKHGDPLGVGKVGRPLKAPLYVLPHGIEVIGEYPPTKTYPYWQVRIRPHAFFPDATVQYGGCLIGRHRAVLASKLGRALTREEHAHHDDEVKDNDSPLNIELLTASDHSKHHRVGARSTAESRAKVSATLKRLYAEGKRQALPIRNRDSKGRIAL